MAEKEQLNHLHKKNIRFVLEELEKENRAMLSTDLSTTTTTSAEEDSGMGARVGVGGRRTGEFSGGAGGRAVAGASWVKPVVAQGKDTTMGNSLLSSILRDPQNTTTSTGADNSTLYPLQIGQTDSGGL